MKIMSAIHRFARDCEGAVAVYIGIGLFAMIPIAALVIDLARVEITQTELKQAADAAAMAAATQLINQPDSIDKATLAAQGAAGGSGIGLTENRQIWAEGGPGNVAITGMRFFSQLNPDVVTTDGTEANFVEVSVTTTTVKNWFISVAQGAVGLEQSNPTAFAVAGYGRATCKAQSMMMCRSPVALEEGEGIVVKPKGGAAPRAGEFGLLETPSGNKTPDELAEYLAGTGGDEPCYGNDVVPRFGTITQKIQNGVNTRFDIYDLNGLTFSTGDPEIYPAWNVVKGLPESCNGFGPQTLDGYDTYDPANGGNLPAPGGDPDLMQYPRDECFYTATCPTVLQGNGDWNRDAYWQVNHGEPWVASPKRIALGLPLDATRYDVYRAELTNLDPAALDNPLNNLPHSEGELGRPTCYQQDAAMPNALFPPVDARGDLTGWGEQPDRRVFFVAEIDDCSSANIKAGVPVKYDRFAAFFVVEPAGFNTINGNPEMEIFMEFIRYIDPGDDQPVAREIVQLYR